MGADLKCKSCGLSADRSELMEVQEEHMEHGGGTWISYELEHINRNICLTEKQRLRKIQEDTNFKNEKLKRDALSKLTIEERKALGL